MYTYYKGLDKKRPSSVVGRDDRGTPFFPVGGDAHIAPQIYKNKIFGGNYMNLYKSILSQALTYKGRLKIIFEGEENEPKDPLADETCSKTIAEIRNILNLESFDDFERIISIMLLLERLGFNGGTCRNNYFL